MTVQRGEIYFVNLNPVQGGEHAGQLQLLVPPRRDAGRHLFQYGRRVL